MARSLSILILAFAAVLCSTAWAQAGEPDAKAADAKAADAKKDDAKKDDAKKDDAKKDDAQAADAKSEKDTDAASDGDAKDGDAKDGDAEEPDATNPAPTPSPAPETAPSDPKLATSDATPRRDHPTLDPVGTIVVATSKSARGHARALARAVYADARLRPRINEVTAQVLSGGAAPADDATLIGQAAVVRSLGREKDPNVQRRLAASLARDLSVRLIVLVSVQDGEPVARVVRMPEERLLAIKLTATPKPAGEGPVTWDWTDTTSMLRELSIGAPPPGPRKKKKDAGGTALATPNSDEGEDDGNLLTSPWFWGGLGLVVTVGATVLILSQTALNEPDMVAIDGRVIP